MPIYLTFIVYLVDAEENLDEEEIDEKELDQEELDVIDGVLNRHHLFIQVLTAIYQ